MLIVGRGQVVGEPHSQDLSSLPPLVVGTETLVAANVFPQSIDVEAINEEN